MLHYLCFLLYFKTNVSLLNIHRKAPCSKNAKEGKIFENSNTVVLKVDTGTTPNTVVYPGDPAWGDATDTADPLDDYYHLNVPVVNEACVYNLWMCACWAN